MTLQINIRNIHGSDEKDITIKADGLTFNLGWHESDACVSLADDLFAVIEDLIPRETIVEMLSKYGYEVVK